MPKKINPRSGPTHCGMVQELQEDYQSETTVA